jgi:GTPase SAR1 family protein
MSEPPGAPEPRERREGRLELPPGRVDNSWYAPDDDRQESATGPRGSYAEGAEGDDVEEATPNLQMDATGWEQAPSSSVNSDAGNSVPFRAAQQAGRSSADASRAAAAAYELSRRAALSQPGSQVSPVSQAKDAVKIGLWGSPSSGKTTYLAALRHAAGDTNIDCGTWGIFPLNQQSKTAMVDFTHALNQGRFPEATPVGTTVQLQWLFVGDIVKSRFARRPHRLWRSGKPESKFELDLIDVSGAAFGYDPNDQSGSRPAASEALTHLFQARGLIYLFDPIRERDDRDALNYVNNTVAELKQRFAQSGYRRTHLPHHVSVCITKFDHPEVFQAARRNGFVEHGRDGIPRVPDRYAEDFFDQLCAGRFWGEKHERGDRSARFVRNELRNAFDPANIEYFVTSSIGFWRPPGWANAESEFDPEDFSNYYEEGGNKPGIRGAISPINVLEPLIRLQQRISGSA